MSSCSFVDAWLKLGRFRGRRIAAEREWSKEEAMSERQDRLAGRAGARPYRPPGFLNSGSWLLFNDLDWRSQLHRSKEPFRLRTGHSDAAM
jgi:hypothetical protein